MEKVSLMVVLMMAQQGMIRNFIFSFKKQGGFANGVAISDSSTFRVKFQKI
jgi:hypothetical protein